MPSLAVHLFWGLAAILNATVLIRAVVEGNTWAALPLAGLLWLVWRVSSKGAYA